MPPPARSAEAFENVNSVCAKMHEKITSFQLAEHARYFIYLCSILRIM